MKLRILQSLGMTEGTLSPGNIAEVDSVTAEEWTRIGFAEKAPASAQAEFVVTPGRAISKERHEQFTKTAASQETQDDAAQSTPEDASASTNPEGEPAASTDDAPSEPAQPKTKKGKKTQ